MQHLNINFKNVLFFAIVYVICPSILQAQEGQNTDSLNHFQHHPGSTFTKSDQKYTNETDEGKYVLDSTYTYYFDPYTDEKNLRRKEYYTYDEYGWEKMCLSYSWNSSQHQWVNTYKTGSMIDVIAHNTTYTQYFWDYEENNFEIRYKSLQEINGNAISISVYNWDTDNNKLLPDFKLISTINESGVIEADFYYIWDSLNQNWAENHHTTTMFDEVGNDIGNIRFEWDITHKDWVNNQKTISIEDENNNIIRYEECKWDTIKNIWEGESKYDANYDEYGNQSVKTQYKWNEVAAQWERADSTLNLYDSDGKMLAYEKFTWNTILCDWFQSREETYTYNSSGNNTYKSISNRSILKDLSVNGDKTETIFDDRGIKLEENKYRWDIGDNDWEQISMQNFLYADNGKALGYEIYTLQDSTNSWVLNGKQGISYNENGKMTEDVAFYDEINGRDHYEEYRVVQTFDSMGRIESRNSYIKCNELDNWVQTHSSVCSYMDTIAYIENIWFSPEPFEYCLSRIFYFHYVDIEGYSTIVRVSNKWDENNGVVPRQKTEETLDEKGNSITYCTYNWDDKNSEWEGSSKKENCYDNDGNEIMNAEYIWDEQKKCWTGKDKFEYSFDENSKKAMVAEYRWNLSDNDWVGVSKTSQTITDKEVKSNIYYRWDYTQSDWTYSAKYDSIFDSKNNIYDVSYFEWNKENSEFELVSQKNHYWSKLYSIDERAVKDIIRIYPNPATDELWFYLDHLHNEKFTVQLYNLYGELVFSDSYFEFIRPFGISVASFPRGLYILSVKSETIDESKKVILR